MNKELDNALGGVIRQSRNRGGRHAVMSYLSDQQKERLDAYCAKSGMNRSNVVRAALDKFLSPPETQ